MTVHTRSSPRDGGWFGCRRWCGLWVTKRSTPPTRSAQLFALKLDDLSTSAARSFPRSLRAELAKIHHKTRPSDVPFARWAVSKSSNEAFDGSPVRCRQPSIQRPRVYSKTARKSLLIVETWRIRPKSIPLRKRKASSGGTATVKISNTPSVSSDLSGSILSAIDDTSEKKSETWLTFATKPSLA